MTGTKPFSNTYGVWVKRTPYNNTTQDDRIDCVTNIDTGVVYVRKGGESGSWVTSNADIRIYGNSSFGYTPGIGSYLNDDNYRPRWARSGDSVVVYGVFAVGIAPTENKAILTGFPKPYSHAWIPVFEMDTMIGRAVYLNVNGEIMSSSIPQGNYQINFCYRAK